MARKGAIVCSYSWYVRRVRRPQAAGAPLTRVPGRGKAARRAETGRMRAPGAQSHRAEPRSRRAARERGLGHGLLAVGGISWPRQSDHKGGCGREPPGAAGGRTEAATLQLGVGWGGAIPGRVAAAALRLLKSKQLPGWCGAPLLVPAPCQAARGPGVVFGSREEATSSSSCGFETSPNCRAQQKEREPGRLAA